MKLGLVALAGFIATVVLANEMVARWGVVSVGLGLTAPAGVYAAGLSFGLRDAVRERLGPWWMVPAIGVGALVSWWVSDGVTLPGGVVSLALASGVAFGMSETADAAVYEPLRRRGKTLALVASNVVGAVADSALFLWLAFGSLDFMAGQVWGKALMIVPCLVVMYGKRLFWDWGRCPSGGWHRFDEITLGMERCRKCGLEAEYNAYIRYR